jgi:hypothetical protein
MRAGKDRDTRAVRTLKEEETGVVVDGDGRVELKRKLSEVLVDCVRGGGRRHVGRPIWWRGRRPRRRRWPVCVVVNGPEVPRPGCRLSFSSSGPYYAIDPLAQLNDCPQGNTEPNTRT